MDDLKPWQSLWGSELLAWVDRRYRLWAIERATAWRIFRRLSAIEINEAWSRVLERINLDENRFRQLDSYDHINGVVSRMMFRSLRFVVVRSAQMSHSCGGVMSVGQQRVFLGSEIEFRKEKGEVDDPFWKAVQLSKFSRGGYAESDSWANAVLEHLAPRQRETVEYVVLQDHSQDDAALIMGARRNRVSKNLAAAKRSIIKWLNGHYPETLSGLSSPWPRVGGWVSARRKLAAMVKKPR